MGERNFIGKQLINIKDKISSKSGDPLPMQQKEIDGELLKALNSKKEDYLKTKCVVVKVLRDTFTKLEKEIVMAEQNKKMYSDSANSVKKLIEEISRVEESKWSRNDFSIELSEAAKLVERARLENIILNNNLNLKEMEESKSKASGDSSVLDILSLTFSQMFKLGFCFFLPLVLGLITAASIIAITLLVCMGTI